MDFFFFQCTINVIYLFSMNCFSQVQVCALWRSQSIPPQDFSRSLALPERGIYLRNEGGYQEGDKRPNCWTRLPMEETDQLHLHAGDTEGVFTCTERFRPERVPFRRRMEKSVCTRPAARDAKLFTLETSFTSRYIRWCNGKSFIFSTSF